MLELATPFLIQHITKCTNCVWESVKYTQVKQHKVCTFRTFTLLLHHICTCKHKYTLTCSVKIKGKGRYILKHHAWPTWTIEKHEPQIHYIQEFARENTHTHTHAIYHIKELTSLFYAQLSSGSIVTQPHKMATTQT